MPFERLAVSIENGKLDHGYVLRVGRMFNVSDGRSRQDVADALRKKMKQLEEIEAVCPQPASTPAVTHQDEWHGGATTLG